MARVIVILALLFLITSGIFILTRPPAGGATADGRTTVALPAVTGGTVASAQDVVGRPSAGAAPALATAGIDNNGLVSFTGTAAPGDRVVIVREDKVLGRGRADKDGSWSMSFPLPDVREGYKLTVRSERGDGSFVSGPQQASVNPPTRRDGLPVIRIEVVEAQVEAPFSTTAAGDEDPRVGIIIETVNADDQGAVRMAGRADPGATLRIEMAGSEAGAARVAPDGRWALEARNNTGAEVKSVRVVLVSASGRELDSSSLPLRLPAPVIVAAGGASPTAGVPGMSAGQRGRWVKVRRGDSLWKLAERHYGSGAKWTRILKANRRRVKDPDLILVGWRLRVP